MSPPTVYVATNSPTRLCLLTITMLTGAHIKCRSISTVRSRRRSLEYFNGASSMPSWERTLVQTSRIQPLYGLAYSHLKTTLTQRSSWKRRQLTSPSLICLSIPGDSSSTDFRISTCPLRASPMASIPRYHHHQRIFAMN